MGTANPDKSSKKRKRVQDENELLEEDDLPSHDKSIKKKRKIKHADELSEEHEPAENKHSKKKRKVQDTNDSSIEEHSQSSKSKQKKKSKNENPDAINSGKTSKKTKRDQLKDKSPQEEDQLSKKSKKKKSSVTQKDVSSSEQEDANSSNEAEEESEMVSTKERLKPKKKGKKNLKVSPSSPNEEEDESDSELEESVPKKKGKKTRKESSSSSNEEEGSDSEIEEQSQLTNSKNKQSSSFGVVDTKLLRDHGGQEVKNKKKMKPRRPNQVNRALDYLRLWKNNFKSWKFSKLYQARLMKNLYNPAVTERDFEICLEYFEKCQGKARENLKSDAMALINEDEGESVDAEKEGRARQVLQMLG